MTGKTERSPACHRLAAARGFNLWTSIFLHAVMNAAWMGFAVAENAAGGLWPNIGRGFCIVVGTVLSRRAARRLVVPPAA